MAQILIVAVATLLLWPSQADAWGPLTHVHLGSEILASFGPMIPAGIYAIIRKYREDFIYGNLMADAILAKKYLPYEKHPHNWDITARLESSACTDSEYAFMLGYLTHLAADTVAHGKMTTGKTTFNHLAIEMRADSSMSREHWMEAMSISPSVQRRNDAFLRGAVHQAIFSFNTNKRLFKGMVALSGANLAYKPFMAARSPELTSMLEVSRDRMVDVLRVGRFSEVTAHDAISDHSKDSLLFRRLIG